jgi:hypothetical protein
VVVVVKTVVQVALVVMVVLLAVVVVAAEAVQLQAAQVVPVVSAKSEYGHMDNVCDSDKRAWPYAYDYVCRNLRNGKRRCFLTRLVPERVLQRQGLCSISS